MGKYIAPILLLVSLFMTNSFDIQIKGKGKDDSSSAPHAAFPLLIQITF